MSEKITTRRAIEVCLSRVKMPPYLRDMLLWHLQAEIKEPAPVPNGGVDALRAALLDVEVEAAQSFDTLTKRDLQSRLRSIERIAARALKESQCQTVSNAAPPAVAEPASKTLSNRTANGCAERTGDLPTSD